MSQQGHLGKQINCSQIAVARPVTPNDSSDDDDSFPHGEDINPKGKLYYSSTLLDF